MRLFGMQLTRQQAESSIGRLDQIGGILPFELGDGRARGVRALRFTTGSGLSFTTLIDRGLDFSQAGKRGTLPFLAPGETRRYELEFRVLIGPEEIDEVVAQIGGAGNGKSGGHRA